MHEKFCGKSKDWKCTRKNSHKLLCESIGQSLHYKVLWYGLFFLVQIVNVLNLLFFPPIFTAKNWSKTYVKVFIKVYTIKLHGILRVKSFENFFFLINLNWKFYFLNNQLKTLTGICIEFFFKTWTTNLCGKLSLNDTLQSFHLFFVVYFHVIFFCFVPVSYKSFLQTLLCFFRVKFCVNLPHSFI